MIYRIYYEGKRKFALPVKNREELMALRNSQQNLDNLSKARQGDDKAKAGLLQLAYNIGHVDGALAGCKSIGSYFFHDIDAYGNEEFKMKELILSKKDEIGLRMLERSASGGWHLVCERRPGTTILENQVRVATILKVEMDTSAKDLQRVVFSTSGSEEDLPYLDDCLFTEPMTAEECEAEYELLQERQRRGEEDIPAGAKKVNKHYRPWESEKEADTESGTAGQLGQFSKTTCDLEARYNGMLFTDIIQKYWELYNDGKTPVDGDRNVLTFELAVTLRSICDYSLERMLSVIPNYWMRADGTCSAEDEAEWRRTLESALKEPKKGMPYRLKQVLHSLRENQGMKACGGTMVTPPEMPAKLPKLIKLLTKNTPGQYKAAVAHAVFPPLATHLCDVRFRYTDNKEHEATLMNCLMAGTGSGKSCIDDPIKYIMEDIRLRDKENERREEEWKKECQRKGANKDKRDRPEGLVIQMIDPDMTKPALVMRMQEAEGHFVYVKLNELDLFEQLKGQTGKQHFQLMCLAFDSDAEYGQTRIGTQSVTARPMCRFNWNASTTILKGRKFFSRVLTDGPISRINFCTIPEEEIGAEQPVFGLYDAAFEEELKQYIDRLTGARGLIDCPQAFALAKKLQAECADFARLSQNDTYWNLSHRACVIAWLKACVLYVANGNKWERTIEDFIRWSLNYDLWCKMQFFGDDIEKANNGEGARIGTRGPRNLLELLPDEFTLDDAKRIRRQQGMSTDDKKCRQMITQWVFRKYVLQITDYSFHKSNYYGKKE